MTPEVDHRQSQSEGYDEVSHQINRAYPLVTGRTLVWSHPAFANRCIYLRNDNEIAVIT